jgi:uncharacterized alpha-E superfamily protein
MSAAYTPGPWRISGVRQGHSVDLETSESEAISVGVSDDAENDDQAMANARLIAAAPELLHALEECVRVIELMPWGSDVHRRADVKGRLANAHAAIAKAEPAAADPMSEAEALRQFADSDRIIKELVADPAPGAVMSSHNTSTPRMEQITNDLSGEGWYMIAETVHEVTEERDALLAALTAFESWYTAKAKKLPGAWPDVVIAARAAIAKVGLPRPQGI